MFGHVTLPTYWWSFPVYSSSRKNWFHIHPRLERWRILPSLSGIPNRFPIFPGVKGRALLGHGIQSTRRSRTWLVIMVSNQMGSVLVDFWIMVISFWLDEHWKAVSSEQTLYSSPWCPADPCEERKLWSTNMTEVDEQLRQQSNYKRATLSVPCISLPIYIYPCALCEWKRDNKSWTKIRKVKNWLKLPPQSRECFSSCSYSWRLELHCVRCCAVCAEFDSRRLFLTFICWECNISFFSRKKMS